MLQPRLTMAFVFAASIALISLLYVSLAYLAATPASAVASAKGVPAAMPGSTLVCGSWTRVASPNSGQYSVLYSVSALSNSDVWAVGATSLSSGTSGPLTEHWDGTSWSVIPIPHAGYLTGVAAVSINDVWAVGYYYNPQNIQQPLALIEHWNGSEWSVVLGGTDDRHTNSLSSVAAVSADDIWAVGYDIDAFGTNTLTEHWDGSTWSIVASPDAATQNSSLNGVTAVSSNDIWTVGFGSTESSYQTLTEHWDGLAWSVVASPNINTYNELLSVSAVSATDVWAVGSNGVYGNGPSEQGSGINGGYNHGLAEHWDGSTWTIISTPLVNDADDLFSVVSLASNDVWAVGVSHTEEHALPVIALIEHWDGTTWSEVTQRAAVDLDRLTGIAAVPGGDLWAVGYNVFTYSSLTAHYHPAPCPPTATPEPPRCPGERFTDVCPGDYFYQHVLDLNDLGVVSGYNTSPPCEGAAYIPCFKPGNTATRGQIAKIVSLAAGFDEQVSGQSFEDVPIDSTFYVYIERMATRSIITGYPCGGPEEPCGPGSLPYFRPGSAVTRGQLSKITPASFGFADEVTGQTFEDVLPASTFYTDVERLAERSIISGYPCGGAGEPCDSDNRPYFRPANNVTRGQIAKIVNLARTQPTPSPTPIESATDTPTDTATPQSTVTATPTLTATSTP